MKSILMPHVMAIKNPQMVQEICFLPMLMTFICDIKIHIIISEPHCVKFFVNPLSNLAD